MQLDVTCIAMLAYEYIRIHNPINPQNLCLLRNVMAIGMFHTVPTLYMHHTYLLHIVPILANSGVFRVS